jgi:hypothetical protein
VTGAAAGTFGFASGQMRQSQAQYSDAIDPTHLASCNGRRMCVIAAGGTCALPAATAAAGSVFD